MNRMVLLAAAGILEVASLYAQVPARKLPDPDDLLLQRAKQLEQLRRLDEAEKIYRDLLARRPDHVRAYLELKGLYRSSGSLETWEALLRNRPAPLANDLQSLVELGEVRLLSHGEEAGVAYWDSLLSTRPREQTLYHLLFQAYSRNALSERREGLALRGREELRDQAFLRFESGLQWAAERQWDRAAEEWIALLQLQPARVGIVTPHILRMSEEPEGIAAVEKAVLAAPPSAEELLRPLLGDCLFKAARYEEAFQNHQRAGLASKKDLERWFQFAEDLRKESQWEWATAAYRAVMDLVRADNQSSWMRSYHAPLAEAIFGLASIQEARLAAPRVPHLTANPYHDNRFFSHPFPQQTGLDLSLARETASLYDFLLTSAPDVVFTPQAHFRIGEIQFRILHDFDAAAKAFQAAVSAAQSPELRLAASLRGADTQAARGDFPGALEAIRNTIATATAAKSAEWTLKEIEMLLLMGESDSAAATANRLLLSSDLGANHVNDLLEMTTFLQENGNLPSANGRKALALFLRGMRSLRQANPVEAAAVFAEAAARFPEVDVADDARFFEGEVLLHLDRPVEALAAFEQIASSPLADLATAMSAEIYDRHLRNREKAIEKYLNVISRFPDSLAAEPARLRLRELQGEKS